VNSCSHANLESRPPLLEVHRSMRRAVFEKFGAVASASEAFDAFAPASDRRAYAGVLGVDRRERAR